MSDLQATAAIVIGKDPGVGDARRRVAIRRPFLRGNVIVTPGSLAAANIENSIGDSESNYLPRWAATADQGVKDEEWNNVPAASSVICSIAGTLQKSFLTESIQRHLVPATIQTAGALIRDLQTLAFQPPTAYRAVLPVKVAPSSRKTSSPGWMNGGGCCRLDEAESSPAS